MKKLIILFFIIFTVLIFAEEISYKEYYEKASIIDILNKVPPLKDEEEVEYRQKISLEIKSGLLKGKKKIIEHPVFKEKAYNLDIKKGDNVVVYIQEKEGLYDYTVIDNDKRGSMIFLVVLFFVFVVIFAKKKGVKAVFALVFTVACIFYGFIPFIKKGYPPIITSIILCFIVSIVSIFLITGKTRKTKTAIIGTVGGTIVSGIFSLIFVNKMRLTGYGETEVLYAANLLKHINLKQLISAGIIIGSIGAVMDVAISISSAIEEIKLTNPDITRKKLFVSGMNIGRDIIGTMVNTLILAYIGSSLFTVLLFALQQSDFPMVRVLNFEFIAVEMVRAVCGSIGILFAVPITAYFGSGCKR